LAKSLYYNLNKETVVVKENTENEIKLESYLVEISDQSFLDILCDKSWEIGL